MEGLASQVKAGPKILGRSPRRHVGFLVDERDAPTAASSLPAGTPIVTWQEMGRTQAACVNEVALSETERKKMQSLVARHYSDHGAGFDEAAARSVEVKGFDGSAARYDAVRSLNLPAEVELLYLGAEVSLCARQGKMLMPPLDWLGQEPSLLEIAALRQSTKDREAPWWRLPAECPSRSRALQVVRRRS